MSLLFNGQDKHVIFGNLNEFINYGTGDFTWLGWVKSNLDQTSSQVMMSFNDTGVVLESRVTLGISGADGKAFIAVGEGIAPDSVISGVNILEGDDTWHLLAAVRASGVLRLYVDGIIQPGSAISTQNLANFTGSDFYIGASPFDGGTAFHSGPISHVAIWSLAATSDDVFEIFNEGNLVDYENLPTFSAPDVWWKMDFIDLTASFPTVNAETGSFPGIATNMSLADVSPDEPTPFEFPEDQIPDFDPLAFAGPIPTGITRVVAGDFTDILDFTFGFLRPIGKAVPNPELGVAGVLSVTGIGESLSQCHFTNANLAFDYRVCLARLDRFGRPFTV